MANPAGDTDVELRTDSEILQRYAALRKEAATLWSRVTELDSQATEHDQVVKALNPMEPSRKCFRLVGGTVEQKTVGEVLPAVRRDEAGIHEVLESCRKQLEEKRQELADFRAKYNIAEKGDEIEIRR